MIRDPLKIQPCIAVIAAVCKCHGLYAWDMQPYSFRQDSYVEFLKKLKLKWRSKETMHLFQDNCSAHTSKHAKNYYKHANIRPIWNIPYKPEYNQSVERVWASVKAKFRPKLLKMMLEPSSISGVGPLEAAVRESMEEFDGS